MGRRPLIAGTAVAVAGLASIARAASFGAQVAVQNVKIQNI